MSAEVEVPDYTDEQYDEMIEFLEEERLRRYGL